MGNLCPGTKNAQCAIVNVACCERPKNWPSRRHMGRTMLKNQINRKWRKIFAPTLGTLASLILVTAVFVGLPSNESFALPEAATCDANCVRLLTSTFEAQASVAVAAQYSSVDCKTIRLRRWPTYNIGQKYTHSFGNGAGIIDARITIRCTPFSGRDPILYVRDFTFDRNLNIRERASSRPN
jgi:hypothetical protein